MAEKGNGNECGNIWDMIRGIKADDIAAKLDRLKQDLLEKMLGAVLATSVSTDSLEQNTDGNFAALLPLERKVEGTVKPLCISDSTHDASNDKETQKGEKGLITYSWSDLEAALVSPKTKIGGGLIAYNWSDLEAAVESPKTKIGEGSSSSIYKGELNNKPVAIKEFHHFDEYVKERFVRELNLVSKLQHEHIVGLMGYCYEDSGNLLQKGNYFQIEENHRLCFVSRYMLNQSLIGIIKGDIVVDFPCLYQIMLGIATGLHHLHAHRRIVHLDLKPENILLDAHMTPKINNFGKARELEDAADEITLDKENLPGTGEYMAPEQSQAYTASAKSDVYSFGVILFKTMSLLGASTSEQGPPKCSKDWVKIIMRSELKDHIRNRDLEQYNRLMESILRGLLDPGRVTSPSQVAMASMWVQVGLRCCSSNPALRPSMRDVIGLLFLGAGLLGKEEEEEEDEDEDDDDDDEEEEDEENTNTGGVASCN